MARPQGGWQQGGWKSSVAEASSRALQTFCLQEEAHLSVAPAPARACFSLREGNGLGRTWTSAPAECCWRCSGRSALTASPNREVFLLASVHPAPPCTPRVDSLAWFAVSHSPHFLADSRSACCLGMSKL